MAQGRSTKIITMIKWIRTIRLSIKNSLSNASTLKQRRWTYSHSRKCGSPGTREARSLGTTRWTASQVPPLFYIYMLWDTWTKSLAFILSCADSVFSDLQLHSSSSSGTILLVLQDKHCRAIFCISCQKRGSTQWGGSPGTRVPRSLGTTLWKVWFVLPIPTRGYKRARCKPRFFIKVPRDLPFSGVLSRAQGHPWARDQPQ